MFHIIFKASHIDITICKCFRSLSAKLIASEFAYIESSAQKLICALAVSFVIPHLTNIQVSIRIPTGAITRLFPVLVTLANPEHPRFHCKDCYVFRNFVDFCVGDRCRDLHERLLKLECAKAIVDKTRKVLS